MPRTPEDNTDLDYTLCDTTGLSMDQLDEIPLHIVELMRKHLWQDD